MAAETSTCHILLLPLEVATPSGQSDRHPGDIEPDRSYEVGCAQSGRIPPGYPVCHAHPPAGTSETATEPVRPAEGTTPAGRKCGFCVFLVRRSEMPRCAADRDTLPGLRNAAA